MREPGRLLLGVTQALGLARLRATVILPAVADMQHECGEAASGGRLAWALARGYWSVASGSACYAAFLPARHVRENWSSLDAPGPRLLRQAWPSAAVVLVFSLGMVATDVSPEQWRLGLGVVALLIPANATVFGPLALAAGVGWALARDRSGAGATLSIGLLGAILSFGFYDLVVPRTNQAYRVASCQARTGGTCSLRKGDREMTFEELGAAATLSEVEGCSRPSTMPSCVNSASPNVVRIERQKRLSIPALGFSLVIFASVLSRYRRRVVVFLGLWLANNGAFLVLRVGERYGVQGEIPVFLGAWGAHLLPLALAGLLHIAMRRDTMDGEPATP
jgi:hypothetical protein